MASYDRQILVPYLRDVCSVEMMTAKLVRTLSAVDYEIKEQAAHVNKQILQPRKPIRTDYKPDFSEYGAFVVIGVIAFIFNLVVGLLVRSAGEGGTFWFVMLFIVCGFCAGMIAFELYLENDACDIQYEKDLEKYNNIVRQNDLFKKRLPEEQKKLDNLRSHREVVRKRLQQSERVRLELYSVDVIPTQYRNIHSSYYLYDYFNTSRETDLDKVIQTLLLDEIKQKLDKVIRQNEEIILNQRAQLALQEAGNMQIAENHRTEMKKIANMERNQELQLDYQQMIAKNQLVTNFFLEADYWNKRR